MRDPLRTESEKRVTPTPLGSELSLLRCLRESKRITQTELAKRAHITRRKVQHIESKSIACLSVKEINDFSLGSGYPFLKLVRMLHAGDHDAFCISKYSLEKATSNKQLEEGIQLVTLSEKQAKDFVGILSIKVNRKIDSTCLPDRDMIFGYVLKGQLIIQGLGEPKVFEEKSAFRLSGCMPFELYAGFPYNLSILIFTAIFSD